MFTYVGETLRRLRKERGKTLDELGQEAGLGRGQLSRIENGRQEATLTTLSKVLVSQGMSRREFFRRYELVEAEAEALDRTGALPAALAEGADEWPAEVRDALKKVEAFVNAAFLQPRPVAQGSIELGDLVILFRVVAKNPPQETEPREDPAPPAPPSKRPSRPRKGR
ncbi:MAG TPA: helix-turn-helix transcriptional regulator [Thermoanaerobaculia bacterium]|nr:helix-turn-helix transcriptional regulator [Thermoanaerobaculia bacterium]